MLQAVLSVSLPDCWITTLAPRHRIEIRVMDRKLVGKDRMKDLFEAQVPRVVVPRFLEEIRANPSVRELEIVSTARGRVVGIAETTNCKACSALVGSNCFVAAAVCRRSPAFEWNLIVPDREALGRLTARLERDGYKVRLLQIAEVQDAVRLTPRQAEVLSAALEAGYLDYPKRIRLQDLATRLGVSKSTVSEAVRRAMTKILGAYFEGPAADRNGRDR